MKKLVLPNAVMVFKNSNHFKEFLIRMSTVNLNRIYPNQDEEIKEIIYKELMERKIVFNEIKECLMIEQKYDESHDKIPPSTLIIAGIIIILISILGSKLF